MSHTIAKPEHTKSLVPHSGATVHRSFFQTRGIQWAAVILTISITGCAGLPPPETRAPFTPSATPSLDALKTLPPPSRTIVAAVYDFPDLTGQHRETESGQAHFSKVVTQGGSAILIRALQSASAGEWFRVVERANLQNVLTERQIIREQRQGFVDDSGRSLPPPQPMLYAGVLFEGGIIGYDTHFNTGGAGARFLGIGASTEYREDVVSVYLRAVSSQTGEVWHTVMAGKRVYSINVRGDMFRYVSRGDILEIEAGIARNEPRLLALEQAIEHAVRAMIIEGSERGLWAFADDEAGQKARTDFHTARHQEPRQRLDWPTQERTRGVFDPMS